MDGSNLPPDIQAKLADLPRSLDVRGLATAREAEVREACAHSVVGGRA